MTGRRVSGWNPTSSSATYDILSLMPHYCFIRVSYSFNLCWWWISCTITFFDVYQQVEATREERQPLWNEQVLWQQLCNLWQQLWKEQLTWLMWQQLWNEQVLRHHIFKNSGLVDKAPTLQLGGQIFASPLKRICRVGELPTSTNFTCQVLDIKEGNWEVMLFKAECLISQNWLVLSVPVTLL